MSPVVSCILEGPAARKEFLGTLDGDGKNVTHCIMKPGKDLLGLCGKLKLVDSEYSVR